MTISADDAALAERLMIWLSGVKAGMVLDPGDKTDSVIWAIASLSQVLLVFESGMSSRANLRWELTLMLIRSEKESIVDLLVSRLYLQFPELNS